LSRRTPGLGEPGAHDIAVAAGRQSIASQTAAEPQFLTPGRVEAVRPGDSNSHQAFAFETIAGWSAFADAEVPCSRWVQREHATHPKTTAQKQWYRGCEENLRTTTQRGAKKIFALRLEEQSGALHSEERRTEGLAGDVRG